MTNALAAMLAKKKAEAAAAAATTQVLVSQQVDTPAVNLSKSVAENPVSDAVKAAESPAAQTTEKDPPPSPLRRLLATPKPPVKQGNVLDVDKAAALIKPELTLEALAASHDGSIPDENAGERFKFTLDLLDAKLTEISGRLDGFSIDSIRSIVSRIMIELKQHPDYEGLYLGDRDVHNIMGFMYAVRDQAIQTNATKVVKAEKKSAKQQKTASIALSLDNLALGDLKL